MTPLSHYVVVRRDLPLGVILAMVAHAAGESFYQLASVTWSSTTMASGACVAPGLHPSIYAPVAQEERQVFNLQAGGENPSGGSTFDAGQTIAIVMGARNENKLLRLERRLTAAGTIFVAIRETDGEYAGQLMAIGLMPGPRDILAPLVNEFQMLKELSDAEVTGAGK